MLLPPTKLASVLTAQCREVIAMSLGDPTSLVKALSEQLAQSSVTHDSGIAVTNDMFYLIPDSTL